MVLIALTRKAKTAVVTSSNVMVDRLKGTVIPNTLSIWAAGLAGSETVKIQFPVVEDPSEAVDEHWVDARSGGSVVSLDVDNNFTAVYAPVIIRVVKSATSVKVAVLAAG